MQTLALSHSLEHSLELALEAACLWKICTHTGAWEPLCLFFVEPTPNFKLKINKLFALLLLHFSGPVRANETKEVTATFQAAERPGYRNLTVTFNSQEITGVSGNIFFYVKE